MKALDKQQALIEAATRLFAEKGYAATNVQEIAQEAGVATGTFYLYFPSKEALFLTLIQNLYQKMMEGIEEERRKAGNDPIKKLMVSIRLAAKGFASDRQLARVVLIQAIGASAVCEEQVALVHAALAGLVRHDLEKAVHMGLIPEQNVQVAARAIVGTCYELSMGWLREHDPENLTDAIPALLEFNLRAIGYSHRESQIGSGRDG